jgi:hypothetical protein
VFVVLLWLGSETEMERRCERRGKKNERNENKKEKETQHRLPK